MSAATSSHPRPFRRASHIVRPLLGRAFTALACAAALLALPKIGAAQGISPADSSAYLIRLGVDTLAIERVVAYPDSVAGEFVTRSPRTSRFTYSAQVNANHEVTRYSFVHYQSGLTSSPVDSRMTAEFRSDSAHVTMQRRDSTHALAYAAPRTTVPLLEPGFGLHQILIARALAAKGQRLPFAWVYVPDQVDTGSIMVGPRDDTVRIETATDTIRAVVDRGGHVLAMTDPGGTLQATVSRIQWPDLDRWANDFMARDAQGKSLGTLSPPDTVRASVGAATVTIGYGRPSKRDRQIFGSIVPWNTVWRTGANWATSLDVDRDLTIGGTRVPAGRYTLFTIPARTGWTLIVSRKTGEWGTEYDPTADFARIPMTSATTALPVERFTIAVRPRGSAAGDLTMAWDTVVATVPIRSAAPSKSGS